MEKSDFTKISAKLREIRIQKGYTQEYVANMANVTTTHISNIENNHANISLYTLILVCNVLDTTIDYVIGSIYTNTDNVIEQEILKELRTKDEHTKEIILKIIRVI